MATPKIKRGQKYDKNTHNYIEMYNRMKTNKRAHSGLSEVGHRVENSLTIKLVVVMKFMIYNRNRNFKEHLVN
jgi:hypothetical protein